MKDLTIMEEIVLIAILRLKGEAYGVTIRTCIIEMTQREYFYGTLYNTLDQLLRKGLVRKSKGEPTPERGGRRKIYYTVTQEGMGALQAAHDLQTSLWKSVSGLALKKDRQ